MIRALARAAVGAGLLLAAAAPARAQLPAPPVSSPEPIHVGAYGGAVFGRAERSGIGTETGVTEANFAVLLSGTVARRLSYFGELEAASTTRENWTGNEEDHSLALVRLYVEYAFADALRIRAGRFLTPVGQWNEIHAEPLTWTAHRPLVTYRPFAKSLTGVMATGQFALAGHDAGYAFYASLLGDRFRRDQESAFVHAYGARAAVELRQGLFVGASAVAFRASRPVGPDEYGNEPQEPEVGGDEPPGYEEWEEDRGNRALFGVDLSWRFAGAELMGEATSLSATAHAPTERGGYLQLAVPIVPSIRLYAVGRTELYDPVVDRSLRVQTLGLTMRPTRHVTLKVERQIPDRPSYRVGDGWYFSASGIF